MLPSIPRKTFSSYCKPKGKQGIPSKFASAHAYWPFAGGISTFYLSAVVNRTPWPLSLPSRTLYLPFVIHYFFSSLCLGTMSLL